MVICPQCGAQNHEDAVWCVKCGMTLKPSAVSGDAPDVGIPVVPAQSLAPEQPVVYQQPGSYQPGYPPAYLQQYPVQQGPPANDDYRRLGGFLLALAIYFSIVAASGVFSVIMYFVLGWWWVGLLYLGVMGLMAALAVMIFSRKKAYLIMFYCWAVAQTLVSIILIPQTLKFTNSLIYRIFALYRLYGIRYYSFDYRPTVIASMIMSLLVSIGIYVGIGIYFHKSKRVAVYFGQDRR